MQVFKLLPVLITIFISSHGYAEDPAGEIRCAVLEDESLHVSAAIFGSGETDQENRFFATVAFQKYDTASKTSTVLKEWKSVPYIDRGLSFSVKFANQEVSLDAYLDDVGALSEIAFDGKSYQLQCEVDWN